MEKRGVSKDSKEVRESVKQTWGKSFRTQKKKRLHGWRPGSLERSE